MDISDTDRKAILKAYKDPAQGLDSLVSFARRTGYPLAMVRAVLSDSDVYSLNKYTRENFPRRKIIVNKIDEIWSADLMDVSRDAEVNDGIRYLLIVQDALSKYTWAIPLKDKTARTVAAAFKTIFHESGRHPEWLWTDEGAEFLNSSVRTLLSSVGTQMYQTHSKVGSVFAERFIRTLRLRLARLADSRGTHRFIDALPELIHMYNTTPHSTTKIAPSRVTSADETRIQALMAQHQPPNETIHFSVGAHVRMADERGIFSKEGHTQRWSRQIYKVKAIALTRPITYTLETLKGEPVEGTLYTEELQGVPEPTTFAYEVVKRRTRKGIAEVFVHWLGYPHTEDVWMKESDLKS